MSNRLPVSDEVLKEAINDAWMRVAPEKLVALDSIHDLTPEQCRQVGDALEEVAQRRYDLFSEDNDDDSDEDPDEVLEERLVHAAILQITGGAPWVLEGGYPRDLVKGGTLPFQSAVETLNAWANGEVRLLKPEEMMLPWPKAKGRDRAIRLLADLVAPLSMAAEIEPDLVRLLRETAETARGLTDMFDDGAFTALRATLDRRVRRHDPEEACRAAEQATTSERLNRIAYASELTSLVLAGVAGALAEAPDFQVLFEARVEIGYATFGLEHHLESYYPKHMVAFDALLDPDRDRQAELASRILHDLVDESVRAMRLARQEAAP